MINDELEDAGDKNNDAYIDDDKNEDDNDAGYLYNEYDDVYYANLD